MQHAPINLKFLAIIVSFGLFAVAVTAYAAFGMEQIDAGHNELDARQVEAAFSFSRGDRAMKAAEAAISNLLISETEQENQVQIAALADAQTTFGKQMALAVNFAPNRSVPISKLRAQGLAIVEQDCKKAIALGAVATQLNTIMESQRIYLAECGAEFDKLSAPMVSLAEQLQEDVRSAALALKQDSHHRIVQSLGLAVAGLVAVMVGGVSATRMWLVSPIKSLASMMLRLADGDDEVAVVGTDRRDEIGGMARTVQLFKEAGIVKRRLEADAALQQQVAEDTAARVAAVKADAEAQQTHALTVLAGGLRRLAQGNLASHIDEPLATDFHERLRSDFNAAIDGLHDAIRLVADNAHAISSGIGEITRASDDMSRRTEHQASSLEQTAAALDEITATVGKTAAGAKAALSAASIAKADAVSSGKVVGDAVKIMSDISQSSREIDDIIGVIDDIAFQTNLLALNAGVEAARAGDAGRGFAVVASEVRALAQRSATAAKAIKSLIQTSGSQVKSGVACVGATGEALGRIVTQVAQVHDALVAIAASAQEQAAGLQQVNTAVNQMDQVTQQNAAMVEESTAASHSLAEETSQLVTLTQRFQLTKKAA